MNHRNLSDLFHFKEQKSGVILTSTELNIFWIGVFWPTKGTGGLQHHIFLIFDEKQQPKKNWFRGC